MLIGEIIGASLFNYICQQICNKEGIPPKSSSWNSEDKYFPKEIADNVPKMFWVLSGICVALGLFCFFFLKEIPQRE